MDPTETALIVPIPQIEAVVGPFRAELDRAASWGVPAHVTVLYPFLAPERIDDETLSAVAEIVGEVSRFEVRFSQLKWFDEAVVWLAPEPADPFRGLTSALWRRFPETPPYAGAHADVVPHLTIGHDAPRHLLDQAARSVSSALPIQASVEAVHLIAGAPQPNSWRILREFPLRHDDHAP